MKQDGIGRETKHKRLLILQNRLRVAGDIGEGGWVIYTGKGMCYGECCEVCKPDDSQTCTPGANNTEYVNKNNFFKKEQNILRGNWQNQVVMWMGLSPSSQDGHCL